jgi:hypothetical protein
MSQQAALNAGREDGAASSPSPRGTGRGRGFEDFLPPREKLSFLWRTMVEYRKCKSRGEYGLVETLVLSCVGVPKKIPVEAQAPHVQVQVTPPALRSPSNYTTSTAAGGSTSFHINIELRTRISRTPLSHPIRSTSLFIPPPSSWRLLPHVWRLGTASVPMLSRGYHRYSGQSVS